MDPTLNLIVWLWTQLQQANQQLGQKDQTISALQSELESLKETTAG